MISVQGVLFFGVFVNKSSDLGRRPELYRLCGEGNCSLSAVRDDYSHSIVAFGFGERS